MSEFIQLHMLTPYAPSNLNRDDLGRPKTAKMGGTDRLRISSQSLKRAWRTSDLFQEAMAGHIGTRTKRIGVEIYQRLVENGIAEKKAAEWARAIAGQFGKLKKEDKKDPTKGLEIEQLVHVSPEEYDGSMKLADTLAEENRAPKDEELTILSKNLRTVDIALFGRMLASSPAYNVEAAAQVAHALTVNRIVVEDDYFTAVDDLNKHEEDAGSAHIGEASFGSGVFYSYVCIDKTHLVENLGGDLDLANKAIRALTETAAMIAPTGKQNSFASRARAIYARAEKGPQQPRQLSAAFLKPVDEEDVIDVAVKRLETLCSNMDEVYEKCCDSSYTFNVEKGEGTLEELLDFVSSDE